MWTADERKLKISFHSSLSAFSWSPAPRPRNFSKIEVLACWVGPRRPKTDSDMSVCKRDPIRTFSARWFCEMVQKKLTCVEILQRLHIYRNHLHLYRTSLVLVRQVTQSREILSKRFVACSKPKSCWYRSSRPAGRYILRKEHWDFSKERFKNEKTHNINFKIILMLVLKFNRKRILWKISLSSDRTDRRRKQLTKHKETMKREKLKIRRRHGTVSFGAQGTSRTSPIRISSK